MTTSTVGTRLKVVQTVSPNGSNLPVSFSTMFRALPCVACDRAIAPVIIRISGWGQDGPYARRPGFRAVVAGLSGFAAINGFADREPVLPPIYLADGVAGIYGASVAMIALREAEVKAGRGQVIGAAMGAMSACPAPPRR